MSEEKNSTAVEYAVPEDRKRLLLYTILYGLLTLVLMLAAVVFYNLTVKYTLGWLGVHLLTHVLGSLLMTWAGFALFNALRG